MAVPSNICLLKSAAILLRLCGAVRSPVLCLLCKGDEASSALLAACHAHLSNPLLARMTLTNACYLDISAFTSRSFMRKGLSLGRWGWQYTGRSSACDQIFHGEGSNICTVVDIVHGVGDLASIPGDAAAQLASEISEAAAAAEKEKLKGNEQLRQGNTELAYGSYSRAIALAPDQAVYYGNRAAAAITLKQYKQAVADGLKVGPQDGAIPNAAGESPITAYPLADVLLL